MFGSTPSISEEIVSLSSLASPRLNLPKNPFFFFSFPSSSLLFPSALSGLSWMIVLSSIPVETPSPDSKVVSPVIFATAAITPSDAVIPSINNSFCFDNFLACFTIYSSCSSISVFSKVAFFVINCCTLRSRYSYIQENVLGGVRRVHAWKGEGICSSVRYMVGRWVRKLRCAFEVLLY